MMPPTSSNSDSITYTLFGPGGTYINGTFPLSSFSEGGSSNYISGGPPPTSSNWSGLSFTKPRDTNSVPFLQALAGNYLKGGIEIKVYNSGTGTLLNSIKLTNFYVTSVQLSTSTSTELSESISVSGGILGFKDWVNNLGFSIDLTNGALGPY